MKNITEFIKGLNEKRQNQCEHDLEVDRAYYNGYQTALDEVYAFITQESRNKKYNSYGNNVYELGESGEQVYINSPEISKDDLLKKKVEDVLKKPLFNLCCNYSHITPDVDSMYLTEDKGIDLLSQNKILREENNTLQEDIEKKLEEWEQKYKALQDEMDCKVRNAYQKGFEQKRQNENKEEYDNGYAKGYQDGQQEKDAYYFGYKDGINKGKKCVITAYNNGLRDGIKKAK